MKTCKNCRFSSLESGDDAGQCLRYAPSAGKLGPFEITVEVGPFYQWPWVRDDDWCGEWEARVKPR